MMGLILLAGLAVCLHTSCMQSVGYVLDGEVSKVVSGDTIYLQTAVNYKFCVRLYGIDAPQASLLETPDGEKRQKAQPFGDASLEALNHKILWQQVQVGVVETDKQNRQVGIIWLGPRNINLEMVREGFAEALIAKLKPPYRAQFLAAQDEAKKARRGIWSKLSDE